MKFNNSSFIKNIYVLRMLVIFSLLLLFSCKSVTKTTTTQKLYEVLTEQQDGGAHIRFFEILSEPREIKMLLSDANLRKKIKQEDINTCNFIILNLGEKEISGSSILIKSIIETNDKIIVEIEEIQSNSSNSKLPEYIYPYTIVKINSKKELVVK
ncbi:protease complex subunit PrcB family protein [Flavobacterium luteum]|uniref:Protease complex subunit PrcB family protein n=1 Tax=Flavobacterium luteum TaxID=2026654 RepID=A0A7J5AA28_9FLAO|nr:protease complex subunit PrcB family protein [Flavobacterium luteum]KAB1154421.1 protease complex subunit PrcB family protein [Flavobacterium luteum]